ncbi:hypothetical protein GOBAR_DD34181 [Gossypium barbadense]|nr:hypothetical protein GOBAR_DD34181 [Gossypium barbadense]
MRLALPNFIVLQPVDKIDYLGYIHEGGDHDGYLRFMEPQAASPYAKFEIEFSASNEFVHIRSCQNNKYWERKQILSISGGYWVTATADKKEDDQSKESSTLFKVTSVDHAMNTVRIMHVQSGCYLCCWRWDSEKYTRGMYSFSTRHDQNGFDIFKFIDWNSLLILPRFVAFKGYNNKYLCLRRVEWDLPYMQFSSDDIGDSTVALEIFPTDDGYVRIKPVCTDKFWRRSPNWIWADSNDSSSKNTDTVFRPATMLFARALQLKENRIVVVYKVTVPPRTKVIVCIIATKGMCDVPFTYMQRDTLYDGTSVTNEIQGGTYTGSNYYSTNFEAKEEALE